jgi:hypothetical protein
VDATGIAARTLLKRARLSGQQGERALRRLGIHVERLSSEPSDVR